MSASDQPIFMLPFPVSVLPCSNRGDYDSSRLMAELQVTAPHRPTFPKSGNLKQITTASPYPLPRCSREAGLITSCNQPSMHWCSTTMTNYGQRNTQTRVETISIPAFYPRQLRLCHHLARTPGAWSLIFLENHATLVLLWYWFDDADQSFVFSWTTCLAPYDFRIVEEINFSCPTFCCVGWNAKEALGSWLGSWWPSSWFWAWLRSFCIKNGPRRGHKNLKQEFEQPSLFKARFVC